MPHPTPTDRRSDRPAIAIVTNHGYAGVDLPTGGAPDTGGQNIYVNNLARALDALGYSVTIFTRGGFPGYDSDTPRDEPEHLTPNVRYVFVKGGGDEFIRKEDIAIALDEEVEWLEAFVEREAREQGVEPWEQYEFWSTHYWDAAVMTTRLIERWRNEIAARTIAEIAGGVAPDDALDRMRDHRHTRAVGADPAHALGKLLLDAHAAPNATLSDTLKKAVRALVRQRSIPERDSETIECAVASALDHAKAHVHHAIRPTMLAQCLGDAVLEAMDSERERMDDALALADRHCWTPHSLGELKDANYKDRPVEVRRDLKFCERRNHERVVCDRTPAFASTSPEISERLCAQYDVEPERIAFFPPGLDTDVFRIYDEDELEPTWSYLEEQTGLSRDQLKDGRVVFEASRMDETKRKDLLLTAFEKVAQSHDHAYCLIGGGPANDVFDGLQKQIDASDTLTGQAFALGAVPEEHMGPLFSIADVYATASEMEGFGMSASQAAAARTAVVGSDLVPYCTEFAEGDAVVFPAGDADALADAIAGLLDDDNDREQRAERLKAGARRLNWESSAADLIDHLRRLGFRIEQGATAQTAQGAITA